MIKKSLVKKLAFGLAFLFLCILFVSEIYVLTNSHHVCCGKDCPICAELQLAEAVLNQVGSAIVFSVVLFALACITAGSVSISNQVYLIYTPVHMKVRLND